MNRTMIHVACRLIRLARLMVAMRRDEIERRIKSRRHDLDDDSLARIVDCIDGMKVNKRQLAAVKWVQNKSLDLPGGMDDFDNAMKIIDMSGLDYNTFDSPKDVIEKNSKTHEKIQEKALLKKFNHRTESAFKDRKKLGDNVFVYRVENSRDGQLAVRHAVDATFGGDRNPWCLVSRKSNFSEEQLEELASMTDEQKKKIGYDEKNDLSIAWTYWKKYGGYPKRIAFKGDRLLGMCAGHNGDDIPSWWDENNKVTIGIPGCDVEDDQEFIRRYFPRLKSEAELKGMLFANVDDESWWNENNNRQLESFIRESKFTDGEFSVLSRSKNAMIRENVALNPNIPGSILEELSYDENHDVARTAWLNPSMPSGVVEKFMHGMLDRMSSGKIKRNDDGNEFEEIRNDKDEEEYLKIKRFNDTLRFGNLPDDIVKYVLENGGTNDRCRIAENPNIKKDVLEHLLTDYDANVILAAAANSQTTKDMICGMLRGLPPGRDFNFIVWRLIVEKKLPKKIMPECVEKSRYDGEIIRRILGEENVTMKDVEKITGVIPDEVIPRLCHVFTSASGKVPRSFLKKILPSMELEDKSGMALTTKSSEMIDILLETSGGNKAICKNIICNETANSDQIRRAMQCFGNRPDYVLNGLSFNPNTPMDVIEKFEEQFDQAMIHRICQFNKNLSQDFIDSHMDDCLDDICMNPSIGRETALKAIDMLYKHHNHYNTHYSVSEIVQNVSSLTAEDLNRIAEKEQNGMPVEYLDDDDNIMNDIYSSLCERDAGSVKALLTSTHINEALFYMMIHDNDMPFEIHKVFAEAMADPALGGYISNRIGMFSYDDDESLSLAAANPKLFKGILEKLAEDGGRLTRLAVANNKSTPTEVLDEILAEDPDMEVARAAIHNLSTP